MAILIIESSLLDSLFYEDIIKSFTNQKQDVNFKNQNN